MGSTGIGRLVAAKSVSKLSGSSTKDVLGLEYTEPDGELRFMFPDTKRKRCRTVDLVQVMLPYSQDGKVRFGCCGLLVVDRTQALKFWYSVVAGGV
jgi:hypothetical protein